MQRHLPWLARTGYNSILTKVYLIVLFRPLAESLHLCAEAVRHFAVTSSDGSFFLSQSSLGLSSKFWHRCLTNAAVSSLNMLYKHWKERKAVSRRRIHRRLWTELHSGKLAERIIFFWLWRWYADFEETFFDEERFVKVRRRRGLARHELRKGPWFQVNRGCVAMAMLSFVASVWAW